MSDSTPSAMGMTNASHPVRDGKDFSHLRRAIREKADQALVGKTGDAGLLSEMTRQLGGHLG